MINDTEQQSNMTFAEGLWVETEIIQIAFKGEYKEKQDSA